MASTSCKIATFSGVISPNILIASPGPGKGCLPNKAASIPILAPTRLTSSLNNIRKGSTTLSFI